VNITATVKDTGAALNAGLVDIEVYNAAGSLVAQDAVVNTSIGAGQTKSISYAFTAPSAQGTYTVKVGVFGANWTPMYSWNDAAGTVTVTGDAAQYSFESGTQGWAGTANVTGVAQASSPVFSGSRSLAANVNLTAAGTATFAVSSPSVPAGKTVTFHLYIPAGAPITSVQPYALQGAAGGWAWSGNYQPISALKTGAWNTLTVNVPANAAALYQLGVQVSTSAAWKGSVYADSVAW